ncbi:MAG: tetratricopeptide repeat protein [Gemmatimonadales bacterium]|nr:tetratricopeptide repeat protein [Gemmatimonadales bacterium]NIN13507.1 tetratricopeptide repeat protein [Gemmatimonadales bacterium]NIN51501.1 tetratricopeptide repeat protein [Gemmatimonadales bacterium]NIP08965.1 tetratricopeptide repeat protein [Gemmatimonadales bacterium]NIR03743.1 tetratricopeptide repeat protein [Gemmatimonadales bacterium]
MDVSPAQQLELAKERFELQDYYGAILLLEELIEDGRAFADAFHLLGLSQELIGQPERALEAFDQALALNPRYVEANIHKGIVLAGLGRDQEAEAAFAAARESGGRDMGGVPAHHASQLANKHAELGEAYAEAGALGRAIEQYRTALDLGPTYHDLRYRLGRLLLEAGRSLEAREELEVVVKARPNSPDAQAAFGLACYLAGDAATARSVWEALSREHPEDIRARAYLGMLARGTAE